MTTTATALHDALAATTRRDAEYWRDVLNNRNCRVTIDDGAVMVGAFFDHRNHDFEHCWRYPKPADALAALVEAEALPEHWLDAARAPRWWCEACEGTGTIRPSAEARRWACGACGQGGDVRLPVSLPALVSVAALGAAALARAEAIVAETWPGARLVWQVMSRSDIAGVHARGMYSDSGESCAGAFSREQLLFFLGSHRKPWPAEPRESCCADVRRAWPALRALAVAEDGSPTGLHIVALDAACVVLGVEAVGEGRSERRAA